MKTCLSCRADVPPPVAVCPFCGARFADAPPRPSSPPDPTAPPPDPEASALPPPRQESHLLQLPPAPMVIMGGARARRARQRRGLWLAVPVALVLVGLVAYGVRARGVALPIEGLAPILAEEPVVCGDAPDCVIVYLAPWDAASRETAELLPTLRAAWAEDGPALEVVVGAGAGDEAARMARAVRGSSWVDPRDALPAALELSTVPTWLRVISGRVVRRVDGTFLPLDRQLEALDLPPLADDDEGPFDERRVLTGEAAGALADEAEPPDDGDEVEPDDTDPPAEGE